MQSKPTILGKSGSETSYHFRKIEKSQLLPLAKTVNKNDFIVIGSESERDSNILVVNFLPAITGSWANVFFDYLSDDEIEEGIKTKKNNRDMHFFVFYCPTAKHIERILSISTRLKKLAKEESVTIAIISASNLKTSEKYNPNVLLQVMNSTENKLELLVSVSKDKEKFEFTLTYENE